LQVFLDEKERIPQRRPVGCQRYKEESRVDSNEDQSVIQVLDADVEEIGRRQIGAVTTESVDFQSQNAVNKRGTMKSNRRQNHERACE
jgi:hypothetical protein